MKHVHTFLPWLQVNIEVICISSRHMRAFFLALQSRPVGNIKQTTSCWQRNVWPSLDWSKNATSVGDLKTCGTNRCSMVAVLPPPRFNIYGTILWPKTWESSIFIVFYNLFPTSWCTLGQSLLPQNLQPNHTAPNFPSIHRSTWNPCSRHLQGWMLSSP